MSNRKQLLLATASVVVGWSVSPALAAPNWTGATSGDWNTGSNWVGGAVPTSSDSPVFPSTTQTTVTFSGGTAFTSPLSAGSNSITKLTFNAAGYTLGTTSGPALNFVPATSVLVQAAGATGTVTINAPLIFGAAAGTSGGTYTITNSSTDVSAMIFNGAITTVASAAGAINTVNFATSASATAATVIINGIVQDSPSGYPVSGKTSLRKGAGTGYILVAGANTYTGGTNIATGAGGMRMSGAGTLGAITNALTMGGGATLDLNGTSQGVGALADAGAVGQIITNNGTGTSTLTAGNGNATGATFAGSLIDHNNAGGSGVLAFTKTGSGSLTLNNANTYTGATTINGGSLILGSTTVSSIVYTGSLGNTAMHVGTALAGTGTFGGIGSTAGSVAVDTGGALAPGLGSNTTGGANTAGNIGKLTINNTLGRSGTNDFGTLSLDLDKTGVTLTSDQIAGLIAAPDVTNGTLALNLTGSGFVAGDTWNLIDWAGEGAANPMIGTFASLLEPAAPTGLEWDNSQLYTHGIVSLAAVPEPAMLGLLGVAGVSLLARRRKTA